MTTPMTTLSAPESARVDRGARRFGYAVAVLVNVALLVVANNILSWDLLPWLTAEFETVLPPVNLSLMAAVLANTVYMRNDRTVIRSTGQIVVSLVGAVAAFQMLAVFPFDFSAYSFSWGVVARVILVVTIVGSAIGIIAEAFKLARSD